MMGNKEARQTRRQRLFWAVLLCAGGLALNLLGERLALSFKLPLFLNCVGTIAAAAVGGYIPGIVVGFCTNVIGSLQNGSAVYYSSLNALIAICAAAAARRGWLQKPLKALLLAPILALIGGGLGSVISWFLNGGVLGEGISTPLARNLLEHGFALFPAQLTAGLLIDLLDKTVSLALAFIVLLLVPQRVCDQLAYLGWRQAPLSGRVQRRAKRKASITVSLRTKVLAIIAASTLLIAVVVTGISAALYHDSVIEQQTQLAYGVVNVVAGNVDAARVDEYLAEGEAAPGYPEVEARLAQIMNSTPDIEYVYVYRIMEDGCHVVFDPDTQAATGADPGDVIPFDDAFKPYLGALLRGEAIDPIISNETYGWLLTVYQPVYDEAGVCQCYAAVDISMERLASGERVFLARVVALFLGFFILIIAVGLWLAEYNVILPINTMALAAGGFAYNSEAARERSVQVLNDLDIRTGDEIENLYHALTKTTEDTVHYIAEAQKQNEIISRLQNGLIVVLADLVESRDKCTGDHVRKTAAYARIIMDQMRKEGVYADQLTDEFVSDVVNSAPLHDVGKIHVPDALLNKPGRLTDEEFAQMKAHTTTGSEIIAKAIDLVSEDQSGYLKEARNLAAYHHEKWNGSGYPSGLAGEQIPLSARIMAVADVFDALVSKRSYKDGFPIEKALDIIREGAGSHFDPQVAKAFLDAEEEVRRVAGMNLEDARLF